MFGSEQNGLNAANGLNAIDGIVRQTAGDKAAIKSLIQSGIISEMQGVLAGMRADEISKAGMMNKTNMPSIAQQVLTPPAPAGLGALPQGGAPQGMPPQGMPPQGMPPQGMPPQAGAPAPQMPMPPQAPQAPQEMQPQGPGMAEGGLASLPVPDDMFNSSVGDSDTQHYAPGGMVAFADGGGAYGDFYNAIVQQESSGRYGVPNAQGSGAMGLGQIMPATAKALSARLNRPYNPALLRGTSPEAREYQDALTRAATKEAWDYGGGDIGKAAAYYQGGPNTKRWGKDNAQYQSDILRRMGGTGPMARQTSSDPTFVPNVGSLADTFEMMQSIQGKRESKARNAKLEFLGISPEQSKKDKDRDLGYALLAASQAFNKPGPFLANLGSALGAMGEPLRQGAKERRAAQLEGLTAAEQAESADYEDRRGLLAPSAALYAEQTRSREAALGRSQNQSQFAANIQARKEEGALDRAAQVALAHIRVNPSDQEGAIAILKQGNPGFTDAQALEAYLKLKQTYAPSAMQTGFPGEVQAGTPAPGGNQFAGFSATPVQ